MLGSLDDARLMEPYSRYWSAQWQFDLPKEEVGAHLSKDLAFLNLALKSHPENVELLLLTGLVAHYAANVDVQGEVELSLQAFNQAQKLRPEEIRAPWFRGSLYCQTAQLKRGAEDFLGIEKSHAWEKLPASFWLDYMECAALSNMPMHVLRTEDHLVHLQAPASRLREVVVETARKRIDPFDPGKKYEAKEAWQGENAGEDTVFTSTSCGLQLRPRGNWQLKDLGLGKSGCLARFGPGPYRGSHSKVDAEIVVVAKQPAANETLLEYATSFPQAAEPDSSVLASAHCPVTICMARKGIQAGAYGKNGDGHIFLLAFEREEPVFPGLIFESPLEVPQSNSGEGYMYFHPRQVQGRIPGKLFYVVLLSTASSAEKASLTDLDAFLARMTVE